VVRNPPAEVTYPAEPQRPESPPPRPRGALRQVSLLPRVRAFESGLQRANQELDERRSSETTLRDQIAWMAGTRAWRAGERYVRLRDRLTRPARARARGPSG
jgi:hypothetical protein